MIRPDRAGEPVPFVDRIEERSFLRSRFEEAAEGHGQVVLLAGAPGIGKSRLARALREAIADVPHAWLEGAASTQFADTPFHAWLPVLGQLVAGPGGDRRVGDGAALEAALRRAGLDPGRALPLVAPLLGLAAPGGYPAPTASPEVTRRRLLATLAAWVFEAARQAPLVVLLEDLHWADPSTLELQQLLVEQGATARLLLLYTARPEFSVPWPDRAHVTQLTVNRLRRQHVREMVVEVAARSALLADLIDELAARADGVPLFVEELTKAVVEVGRTAAMRELPRTLDDSLRARIDRLGPEARAVAQAGAVCGREFRHDVLHAVHPVGDGALASALQKLCRAELLYVRGFPPAATYTFKHALVQDSAYASLPDAERQALHARVAAALSMLDPALAEEHPEVLARHHAEAGATDAAVDAWHRAGERALQRGAFSEADTHLGRALELLGRLPEGPERATRELPLHLARCFALALRRGYSAPETAAAWARARASARNIADPLQLCALLGGAWLMTLSREGPGPARPLADELLDAAARSGSPWYVAWGHLAQAVTRCHAGDYAGALEYAQGALERAGAPSPAVEFTDWRIPMLGYAMRSAWHLGRTAQARRCAADLAEIAAGARRAFDRAMACQFLAVFHATMAGDLTAAEAAAERGLAACAEEPNPTQESFLRTVLGWMRGRQGQLEAGLAMMRAGLDVFVATGQRLSLGFRLGLLVEGHALAGQTAEALRLLDESESACPSEACLQPMHLGLRAELLQRAGGGATEVEATYADALASARSQGSVALELRVALSYARWLGDDRAGEARALLAPLCARMGDDGGADTRAARAILREAGCAASLPAGAAGGPGRESAGAAGSP